MTPFKNPPIEEEYPHHVDILVPPRGLGRRIEAMYDFHTQHGIKAHRGKARYDAKGSLIRWYFADPSLAALFAGKFKT